MTRGGRAEPPVPPQNSVSCPQMGDGRGPLQASLQGHHASGNREARRDRNGLPSVKGRAAGGTGRHVGHPDGLPTEESHIDRPGLGRTLDGHSRNDPQRALRPDKELLQVIACVVLPQGAQAVQDGAVGQYLAKEERDKALYMGPRGCPSPPAPTPEGPSESRAGRTPTPVGGPGVTPGLNAPNRAERTHAPPTRELRAQSRAVGRLGRGHGRESRCAGRTL